MKQEDEKLRVCLRKAIAMDDIRLDEEMKNSEPHEFSWEFEEKMEKVRGIAKRKTTPFRLKQFAAAAAVLLVVVGVLGVGLNATKAENPSMDILAWVTDYFTFEKGNDDRREEEILFTESQFGYIPDGFEKVGEIINFSFVIYEYENSAGDYFILNVTKDKASVNHDNDGVEINTYVNLAGYECIYLYKDDQCHMFLWEDSQTISYNLSGTMEREEMIAIMDGIQYGE